MSDFGYIDGERAAKISKLKEGKLPVVVILEDIHDAHNAAAVWRSCDAFGVKKVCLIFNKEAVFDPKKVGKVSSSSANKWLDFEVFTSTKECFEKIHKEGYTIYGTVLDKTASSLGKTKFIESAAVAFGNEHAGLSEEAINMVDKKIYISMRGMVQSLNLSVTAGICLWEYVRQIEEIGR